MLKPVPTLINLTADSAVIRKPWHKWIERASRNIWTIPHAQRRLEIANTPKTITVLTAPNLNLWQARLIADHLRRQQWIAPRMFLTSGHIPQIYQNPLSSFEQEKLFFIDLGIRSKTSKQAAISWIRTLMGIAASRHRTICFVPLVFLWNRSPKRKSYPPWFGFLFHNRHKLISTGAPLIIEPGVTLNPPEPEAIRKIQIRDWNQESHVITGDRKVSIRKMIETIQKEPLLKHQLDLIASQGKDTTPTLLTRVSAHVREIADDYTNFAPQLWDKLIVAFFNKSISSLEVDHDGLDSLRILLRQRKKVLLVPSHRSHLDYMLISYSIYKQGLACPRVAAGINLAFWPMGYVFRKTGAFFIRRTFKGLDIYPAVFRAYLWHIMHKCQPVEFFIEGGRSRTGALLPAKLGMLNMVIEAVNSNRLDDVHIVPLAVNYDRIPEEQGYIDELSGKPKQKERLTGLVKSFHLLKRQYGNVSVATGKPLSLKSMLDGDLSNIEQKDLLGGVIMNQIRLTMPITPASMLIIGAMGLPVGESIFQLKLIERAKKVFALIRQLHPDAPVGSEFNNMKDTKTFWFEAIHRMVKFGNIIPGKEAASWQINPERRYQSDYLRNSIFGLLLAPCLVSWEISATEHTLSASDIARIICPEYHPIPVNIIYNEIQACRKICKSWDKDTVDCLNNNILTYVDICEKMNTAILASEKPFTRFMARDWKKLFISETKSIGLKNPETTSTAVQTSFFRGFKHLKNSK